MNPKVGGSSPPQVETFSVSKTLTLSQEHPFVIISNVNFTSNMYHNIYKI